MKKSKSKWEGKVAYPYQKVTDFFVAALEDQGIPPWEKSWTVNGTTTKRWNGKEYRGTNWLSTLISDKQGPWLTKRMMKEAGGWFKKGEKPIPIVFWKVSTYTRKDDDSEERERTSYQIFFYAVWSLEQTTVKKEKYPKWLKEQLAKKPVKKQLKKESSEAVKRATEAFLAYVEKYGIEVEEGLDGAYYSPKKDKIGIPAENQYKDMLEYIRTRSHETIHSTGLPGRCARFDYGSARFGTNDYSKEELVAEIGAAMLDATFGLQRKKVERNSAAYVKSWIKRLKDDPKLIVSAAQRAQKAVDFVLGKSYKEAE